MPKPVNKYCEVCETTTTHLPGGDNEGNLKMYCMNHKSEPLKHNTKSLEEKPGVSKIDALEFIKSKHNGELPYVFGTQEYSRWMADFANYIIQKQNQGAGKQRPDFDEMAKDVVHDRNFPFAFTGTKYLREGINFGCEKIWNEHERLTEVEDCNKRTILSQRQEIGTLKSELEQLKKERDKILSGLKSCVNAMNTGNLTAMGYAKQKGNLILQEVAALNSPAKQGDPRDNPLTSDDSWIHDVDMGAR